ncbi:MAG: hypothetical protein ACE5GM_04420 [bacterium]
MDRIVTSKYNWVVQLNPLVMVTNIISGIRSRYDFLQRYSLSGTEHVNYLTIRERYSALVDPRHIPHTMPGMRYFIEFMNFSYSIGAYAFRGTDYLNHGFFEDLHQRKRGFDSYFKEPSEATLWIATRNSFSYWLHHSRKRLGPRSLDFIFIQFFEKMANEGVRRAVLEPDFDSGRIVSRDLRYMFDYWGKAIKRVWKKEPLFTEEEWASVPEEYRKLISDDLVNTMDFHSSKELAGRIEEAAC